MIIIIIYSPIIIGLFHKKFKQEGLRTYFLEKKQQKKNSEIFRFITLPLEVLDKRKPCPCKFCEIVLHPLEILRPKMKTHYGNSTWYFLDQSWKFHFFYSWPLEFPHHIFLVSIKNPCPKGCFIPSSFEHFPLVVLPAKIQKSKNLNFSANYGKTQWNIIYETTKVPNMLRCWKTATVFIGQ